MPGQARRERSVRYKLNVVGLELENKNVLLVDDSIVRGTTSRQIVEMAREAGARKVFFASAAPPVRYANIYGIDMPTTTEFVAYNRSEEEVSEIIGADWLVYQQLDDLIQCASEGNPNISNFECSVFDGKYRISDAHEAHLQSYLNQIADARCDAKRQKQRDEYADTPDPSMADVRDQ